jgi:hypothetical protein
MGQLGLLTPKSPEFDLADWVTRPYAERVRMMCQTWAMQGFGAPPAIYLFYVVKIGLYVGGWLVFAALTPALGGPSTIGTWWAEPVAFQKAVLWTLLFEGLGFGCASGPLTARYWPPISAFLYFLRPGTTRLPPFRWTPFTKGHLRSWVDVALFVVHLVVTVRALLAPELTTGVLLPVVLVLPLLGLRDKTVFLASRAEHYWVTVVVFLVAGDLLAGSKAVQLAIWWGAATSKLNHHFPSVVAIMISNSPLVRSQTVRRMIYKQYPDDLRPSRLTSLLAHGGTAVEYTFPLILLLSSGGWPTTVALVVMVTFHLYILTSFPMGVPLEWNVFFIYSALVLFGVHADVRIWSISSPWLAVFLLTWLVVIPVVGNLRPSKVSFLPSMRYYAGNWATSLWLFRDDALFTLDEKLTKSADTFMSQLSRFYDDLTIRGVVGRAFAFRSMHLHGRILNALLHQAVDDIERYEVVDGELIGGVVVGWNFGDGHLHHEQLLAAVQAQCGFAPGELRCIFLESQPAHTPRLHWRIADAATGPVADGYADIRDVLERQPWDQRPLSGMEPLRGA